MVYGRGAFWLSSVLEAVIPGAAVAMIRFRLPNKESQKLPKTNLKRKEIINI
jgi:hypothetical protein